MLFGEMMHLVQKFRFDLIVEPFTAEPLSCATASMSETGSMNGGDRAINSPHVPHAEILCHS